MYIENKYIFFIPYTDIDEMSDSSSMMIVLMMGAMASCVMSVIGGLGIWYVKDPTLGGLLEDLGDGGGDESVPPPGDDPGPVPSGGDLPLDQKVYIHGTLGNCDGTSRWTLLYAPTDADVNVDCKRNDGVKKENYLWTIKEKKVGKWTYYTIKNVGQSKYLKADSSNDGLNTLSLTSDEFVWRIKAQASDSSKFHISSKDKLNGKIRMLDFGFANCQEKEPAKRRIHANQLGDNFDYKNADQEAQMFKFRKASSGWKDTTGPCPS